MSNIIKGASSKQQYAYLGISSGQPVLEGLLEQVIRVDDVIVVPTEFQVHVIQPKVTAEFAGLRHWLNRLLGGDCGGGVGGGDRSSLRRLLRISLALPGSHSRGSVIRGQLVGS